MFAIAFDLTVADVETRYSKHVSQAYAQIGSTLRQFGFRGLQGSVYLCNREDLANLTSAMVALRALPWFPACVRNIRAFRVEQWSDFTAFLKEPVP